MRGLVSILTALLTTLATPAAADPVMTKGFAEALRASRASLDLVNQPTFKSGGVFRKLEPKSETVNEGILSCARTTIRGVIVNEECMTRMMPLIEQTDFRLPPEVALSASYGCFDASALTVLLTQLAHAHPMVKPEGRTAMLGKAIGNATVPPEIAALTMLYRMQMAGQRQRDLLAGGFIAAQHGTYYRLQEAAPDFNSGKVAEMKIAASCDPYADGWCGSATNFNAFVQMYWAGDEKPTELFDDAMVKKRMRQGQSMVLGYVRFTPRLEGNGKDARIVFDIGTPHKVVPSGFSARGRYQLVINDVGYTGAGKPVCGGGEGCLRARGTLRRDLKAKLGELGFPDVPFTIPAGVGAVVLEHEGDNDPTLRFIEFVNSLSVRKAS